MPTMTFTIRRFVETKSFSRDYSFEYMAGNTVLDGLIFIKEKLDPTLAFTASCRNGVCGACALRVNGQAVLACETAIESLAARYQSARLTITPLGNFTVLRDLVVDWQPKLDRMKQVKPWLIPQDAFSADTGCRQSQADFDKIRGYTDCILCGACVSECSKLAADSADFLEPFAFVKAQKYVADSRDDAPLKHLDPAIQAGLWRCMHCEECTAKCPKSLDPAEDIAKLRVMAFKKAMVNSAGAQHAQAFYEDINDIGRLNEAKLAIRTDGIMKSLTRVGLAYRLMKVDKLDPFHLPEPIKNISKVQKILKAAKEADKS